MEVKNNPSKVEIIKAESQWLSVPIVSELQSAKGCVSEEAYQLLKFHGTYQQDDRDTRAQRRKAGEEKDFSFMVRNRIPAGTLTASQFLEELRLADEFGFGHLRLTTRQSIQLHGIPKRHLHTVIHRINEIGLSTQSACGDVVRNVTCCPAPVQGDKVRREMRMLAQELAILFSPMAPTYARLWVDAKTLPSEFSNTDAQGMGEPIYGEQYLPRKFKIGLACSDDNCIDVYDQDIGLMAVRDGSGLLGYNVLVGGGLGTSPSDPKSFPALAVPLTFIQAAYVKVVCTAIVLTQRDFGDRSNRRQARLKYLIDRWGRDRFFQAVESRLDEAASILGAKPSEIPSTLPSPIELKPEGYDDHLGWYPQNDSCGYLGILVPNGRVRDSEEGAFKTGLRSVLERFDFPCAITAQQNLLLTRIPIEARQEVEGILCEHKIPLVERVSRLERHSMACPALPTCGLALAESERVIKHLVADFEQLLQQLKLSELRMELRMTGCPNGCSRPYNAEVALVGRSRHVASSQGVYDVFLGGSPSGHRLNRLFREKVRFGEVISALRPVMTRFSRERGNGESFGDYCDRVGLEALSDDSSTGQTTE